MVSLSTLLTNNETSWIDGNALGAIIGFENPHKSVGQLKHIVSQAANNTSQFIKYITIFTWIDKT